MIQILYSFIGAAICVAVIFIIIFFIDFNDKYENLEEELKNHINDNDLHNRKIPYRNNSYQYAPYRPPYYGSDSDLRYRVNQLNDRVNDILDDLDTLKLKWEEEFDLRDAEDESKEEQEDDS